MITVIVPVYNAEKSIEKCIDSILNQTYQNIELLLIDDGSKDQSAVVCEKYVKKDSRVRFVKQENHGVSYTRNKGIELAQGEYIQFVDSDDYLSPYMCEKLYESAWEHDADMVMCGIVEEREDSLEIRIPKVGGMHRVDELKDCYSDFFDGFLLNSPCNKLYKKEKIKELFLQDISLGEDLIFNLQNMVSMSRIVFVEEGLYHYIIHQGSLTRSYRKDEIECAERIYIESKEFFRRMEFETSELTKISQTFVVFLFYGFSNLYSLTSFSKREKKSILKMWVHNLNVQQAAKDAVVEKGYQKVALWMLKNKNVFGLNFLFTLRSMMR